MSSSELPEDEEEPLLSIAAGAPGTKEALPGKPSV
jgi:hypothetical protein